MNWQFGGDFEPLITGCKLSWTDCPIELAYYIWYEAVTDVVDCFANETILWTILAALFICTFLFYLIKLKIRWIRKLDSSVTNFIHVDSKLRDLELKVNILTYKAQYGSWPLLQIANDNIKKSIGSVQPLISHLNDENTWIKYLLLSPRRKEFNRNGYFCNIQSQLSIADLKSLDVDQNYMPLGCGDTSIQQFNWDNEKVLQMKLEREQVLNDVCNNQQESKIQYNNVVNNKFNLLNSSRNLINKNLSPCDKSLINTQFNENYTLGTKKSLQINADDEDYQSELEFFNNFDETKKLFEFNPLNDHLKPSPSYSSLDSNINLSTRENIFPNSLDVDRKANEAISKTLDQAKSNLENIHLTLKNYCTRNFWDSPSINNQQLNDLTNDLKEETIKYEYEYLENPWNEYNYETNFDSINSVSTTDYSRETDAYCNSTTEVTNESEPIEFSECSYADKYSIVNDKKIEFRPNNEQLNIFTAVGKSENSMEALDGSSSDMNITPANHLSKIGNYNKSRKCLHENSTISNETQNKLNFNSASKEINLDNQSTMPLPNKALKVRKELLLRIDSKEGANPIHSHNTEKHTNYYLIGEQPIQETESDMLTREVNDTCSGFQTDRTSNKSYNNANYRSQDSDVTNNQFIEANIFKNNPLFRQESINLVYDGISTSAVTNHVNNADATVMCNTRNNFTLPIVKSMTNIEKNNDLECITDDFSCDEIEAIDKVNKINANLNYDFLNFKNDFKLTYLSNLPSDVSIDKLIDQLIESEKKSDSKFSQLKIEECHNFLSKYNNIEVDKTLDDEILNDFSGVKVSKNFNTELSKPHNSMNLNNTNFDALQAMLENESDCNKNLLHNSKFNIQDDSRKNADFYSNVDFQKSVIKNKNNSFSNRSEERNLDNFVFLYNSKQLKNENQENKNNFELKTDFENNNDDKSIKHTDLLMSDNNILSNIDCPIKKFLNANKDIENEKIKDIKDAGDFYPDTEMHLQNFKEPEDISNIKATERIKGIVKSNLPCGDTNPPLIESKSFLVNFKKSNNQISHKILDNNTASSAIRKSVQNIFKLYKTSNFKIVPKVCTKNILDQGHKIKHLKAKSNFNLLSIEEPNPIVTQRRSKSYTSSNNTNESKIFAESFSEKLNERTHIPKEFCNYDKVKQFNAKIKNPEELPNYSNETYSQSKNQKAHKQILNVDKDIRFNNTLSCKSNLFNAPNEFSTKNKNTNKTKHKNCINRIDSNKYDDATFAYDYLDVNQMKRSKNNI